MFDVRVCLEVLVSEFGLDGWVDRLAQLARPTVLLDVASGVAELGATKLGGCPDLPTGVDWPSTHDGLMGFIGQVDLGEIAALDCLAPTQPVPRHGMLYFFAEQDGVAAAHQLIYVAQPGNLARCAVPTPDSFADPDQDEPYPELVVREFVAAASLPDWGPDDVPDGYSELVAKANNLPDRTQPTSRLFGHPLDYQGKREDEEVIFHVESFFQKGIAPMNFWDAGYLEVTIQRELLGKSWSKTSARIFSM